jgi:hypothetical protein
VKKSNESSTKIPIVPPKGNRDERKEFLQESVNKYLEAIEVQIGDLKKVGKNTLVIGGVIVAAYAVTELLLPSANQRNNASGNALLPITNYEEKEEGDSIVWSALKGAAMSLLLTVAKDRLLGLLHNLSTNDAESNS